MAGIESLKQLIVTYAYNIPYDRYKHIHSKIADDPSFYLGFDRFNLDLEQRNMKSVENFIAVEQLARQENMTIDEKRLVYSRLNQFSNFSVQFDIIYNAFRGLASQSQSDQWLKKIERGQISSGFAQTELGHGTEMRKLETTAIYDPATREIVINSPTLQSIKWWIGSNFATTHLIIFAQLHISRKNEGLIPFFVQIRDLQTLELLPGVESLETGPNAGLELQIYRSYSFKNFRVPASSLLEKFVSISLEGKLVLKYPNSKSLISTALLYMRTLLVSWSWRPLAVSLTIAIRYSDYIRQLKALDNTLEECNLMDYRPERPNLVRALANCLAQLFAGKHLFALYKQFDVSSQNGDFSLVPELTAISAVCKAFFTWNTLKSIEVCRQACGIHYDSLHAGIPQLFINYMPTVTFEGDNTVMAMLSSKFLLTSMAALQAGKQPSGDINFLGESSPVPENFESEEFGTIIFSRLTKALTERLRDKTQQLSIQGLNARQIGELYTQVDSVTLGRAYNRYFTHRCYLETLHSVTDPRTRRILDLLRQVYVVTEVLEFGSAVLGEHLLGRSAFPVLRAQLATLSKELGPSLIDIVDSFDFSEKFLCSDLANKGVKVSEYKRGLDKENSIGAAGIKPKL